MADLTVFTLDVCRLRDGKSWRARVRFGCPEQTVEGEARAARSLAIESAIERAEAEVAKEKGGIFW